MNPLRVPGRSFCIAAVLALAIIAVQAAGSVSQVKDINVTTLLGDSEPRDFVSLGGFALFVASDAANGEELWRTDGTREGTWLVKDIYPGPEDSFPEGFRRLGDVVFFAAEDGSSGHELWQSDGTTAGTVLVRDINHGVEGSDPRQLTVVGNEMFFDAVDGIHGREPRPEVVS